MSPSGELTIPATRRSRQSIGANLDSRKAMDKENATTDVSGTLAANRIKSRSKSLGPGGLDALRQGSGNRRASLAAHKTPRSILKPTISALPQIPPLKKKQLSQGSVRSSSSIGSEESTNTGSKIALKTEEQQQAAAREREERERRDARRKSLASRRVSFAAEATLHTFHDLDYNQDSTTSTDASRRNSSATNKSPNVTLQPGQGQLAHGNQPPSTQQRRNSSIPQPSAQHDDDNDSNATSVLYSSDSEPADAVEEIVAEEDDGSSSNSDDGTMISVDAEEITGMSVVSDRSLASTAEESTTLDEALRLAAQRAGTQRLDDPTRDAEVDDDDDGEEVIPSFGWIKKSQPQSSQAQSRRGEEEADMDITTSVGGIIKPQPADESRSEPDEDMSMEVTSALGGILSQSQARKTQSSAQLGDDGDGEATMELTTAVGSIQHAQETDTDEHDENEDMSMELTTAIGGVLGQRSRKSISGARRRTATRQSDFGADDSTMDLTISMGQILSNVDQGPADQTDNESTMGMDITAAVGGILSPQPSSPRALGKRVMEEELDKPNSPNRAVSAAVSQGSPRRKSLPFRGGSKARDNSHSRRSLISSTQSRQTPEPPAASQQANLLSSSPLKPGTPQQASPARRGALRPRSKSPKSPSPAKPATRHESRTPSPAKSGQRGASIFDHNSQTGARTPTVVLTPQPRRLSGVGADRTGLGSPRVAALFERRGSIGDAATGFVPGKRTVAFQDPKALAAEVDRERQQDEDRESGRKILEREADGDKEATLNLREMIDSLSPRRKPLAGRKSLHVGSASGLLGKRPMELDDDEEAEENDGVKRLKGLPKSPVKNVRLQQHSTKADLTAPLPVSFGNSMSRGNVATPSFSSPIKGGRPTTPKDQGRFKDVPVSGSGLEVNFHDSPVKDDDELIAEVDDDRIQLQDFLNMTSIRFMELNTTKRRHTVAPSAMKDGLSADGDDDMSLQRCVRAGACTVPTLELYQHSCRELKKYISEGREMVQEIEMDTFEENPPLFREYISATSEVKALMDNQFKNVKTNARLLSKAMWYEWRMKLQDGLKEGLDRIADGMTEDDKVLQKQQDLLDTVLPNLVARCNFLADQRDNLQEAAQELADCDPTQLQGSRTELGDLNVDIEEKRRRVAELRQELSASETEVDGLTSHKQELLTEIKESEKIREECRGWTSSEVDAMKARVDSLEKAHGWAVTGISNTTLSMTYKRDIELVFDISAFQPDQQNAQIDLWYIGDTKDTDPAPKTTEKMFFLQCIRDHIRALPQSRTKVSDLLATVGSGWDTAGRVFAQLDRVNIVFPTDVAKTSDSTVAVTTSLLLVPLETRVEITFGLSGSSTDKGMRVSISPAAKVVYGENFNVAKVGEFLTTRVGDSVGASEEDWSDILVELHQRLIARGRK